MAAAIQRGEMSPLDWFKIGVGQPPQQTMAPWIQPNASLGQILAGAGAQAGNTAARYFLNRDLANRYGQQNPNYYQGYQPYQQQYSPYEDQSQWPAAGAVDAGAGGAVNWDAAAATYAGGV